MYMQQNQGEENPFLDPQKAFGNVPSMQPHIASLSHMSLLKPGSYTMSPTRVCVLLGCASNEELKDDNQFREIFDDIRDGLAKFGNLTNLIIPRPAQGLGGVGRVYAEYKTVKEAIECAENMKSATYNDNFIKTVYWPQSKFDAKNLE